MPERTMATRQPEKNTEKGKSTADYYKLNTKAIEELVSANKENSPAVSPKELKRYGAKKHLTLSQWLKALLIKIWLSGAVCYFFLWGLGSYIRSSLDLWLVTAAALGFVTDLVTNNILRLAEKDEGASVRYMMLPQKKKFYTLPLNVLYACVLMALDITTYALLRLDVEPVLFGVITTLWDLALIEAKHLIKRIVADAREKAGNTQR